MDTLQYLVKSTSPSAFKNTACSAVQYNDTFKHEIGRRLYVSILLVEKIGSNKSIFHVLWHIDFVSVF